MAEVRAKFAGFAGIEMPSGLLAGQPSKINLYRLRLPSLVLDVTRDIYYDPGPRLIYAHQYIREASITTEVIISLEEFESEIKRLGIRG